MLVHPSGSKADSSQQTLSISDDLGIDPDAVTSTFAASGLRLMELIRGSAQALRSAADELFGDDATR